MEAKILANLWQVGGPGFTSPDDAAVYLVRFGGKAVLVDAGFRFNNIFVENPLTFRDLRCT